jgi:hypothetical protein
MEAHSGVHGVGKRLLDVNARMIPYHHKNSCIIRNFGKSTVLGKDIFIAILQQLRNMLKAEAIRPPIL